MGKNHLYGSMISSAKMALFIQKKKEILSVRQLGNNPHDNFLKPTIIKMAANISGAPETRTAKR